MTLILALKLAGKPVLRGRHHYWNVMMALDREGPFTSGDVYRQTNDKDNSSVQRYVRDLTKAGVVEIVGRRDGPAPVIVPVPLFRIVRRSQLPPSIGAAGRPLTRGLTAQCMWNVLRGSQARRGLTTAELALLASTEAVKVTDAIAKDFCQAMRMAGKLRTIGVASRGVASRYVLAPRADTGPRAPVVMRSRFVYDPNTNEVVTRPIESEEVTL